MVNATKSQRIALVLMLLALVGSAGYMLYQNYAAQQALEENVEYQVVKAIEYQHPEVYVISVEEHNNNILVYFIMPPDGGTTNYAEHLLIDVVTVLYEFYPEAETYQLLPTMVVEIDTFDGMTHVGFSNVGYGFTNFAAMTLAGETQIGKLAELILLYDASEMGSYPPEEAGIGIVAEPTAREKGHIPPWVEPEENTCLPWLPA